MRLFIAIDLPDNIKDLASRFEKELSQFDVLRFVKHENMEMTLTFIGEVPDNDVDEIRRRLRKIKFDKFMLKTSGFGFFPSNKRIRVLWLGLEKNDMFFKLQHDIRDLFGHKEKFMPHITIARARKIIIGEANKLDDRIKGVSHEEISFEVNNFRLYSSILKSQGPMHEMLEEYPCNNI